MLLVAVVKETVGKRLHASSVPRMGGHVSGPRCKLAAAKDVLKNKVRKFFTCSDLEKKEKRQRRDRNRNGGKVYSGEPARARGWTPTGHQNNQLTNGQCAGYKR